MRRYLRVYSLMVRANIAVLASYRVAFINTFFSGIVWGCFLLISAIILTTKITSIAGWSGLDLVLLSAMYNVVMGTFYTFIAPNFHDIPEIIQYGRLDLFLVRPMDAQFLLQWKTINLGGIGRLILGFVAVGILMNKEGISLSLPSFAITFFCVLLSCLFLYGVWASVSCFLFWQQRLTNIIDLLYTTTGFGRYPRETLFGVPLFLALVATPFFLTVSTPTQVLRGAVRIEDVFILSLATVFVLLLSRLLWKLGLRGYTSASS